MIRIFLERFRRAIRRRSLDIPFPGLMLLAFICGCLLHLTLISLPQRRKHNDFIDEPTENANDVITVSDKIPTYEGVVVKHYDIKQYLLYNLNYPPKTRFALISTEICAPGIDSIVVVLTSPENQAARTLIRETWGNRKHLPARVKLIFMMGGRDSDWLKILTTEGHKHGDIVVSETIDNFRNRSLTMIAAFGWLRKFCTDVKLVMKVDDTNVMVNVKNTLREIKSKNYSRSFVCLQKAAGSPPNRHIDSIWYVSQYDYPGQTFPSYCYSPVYLFTADLLPDLVRVSAAIPYMEIEDVYITGILAGQIKANTIAVQASKLKILDKELSKDVCEFVLNEYARISNSKIQRETWNEIGRKSYQNVIGECGKTARRRHDKSAAPPSPLTPRSK
ncbi:beta-1,3-galactosyltransferase 5-like [Tubulanus polymorphus]|uniref:beta-1,3-galactosyltransferase 5-like n=1 Tax=Tubulanus polymorphus TaxID=672921 RepID=UPI003DA2966C